ncbi:hypothetical protein EV182_005468 [Spiromyces aspiralis]|uniref:Uncharacterized protein n=1 Tax=Spiromyces aspiralis TaxID=68401 RepID=A0ACC1HCG6_9FUNG|nr:hypothetical protein EV182_005468 [Spiromyces aspiralis]
MARVSVGSGSELELCGGAILSDRTIVTAAHCLTVKGTTTLIRATNIVIGVGATVDANLTLLQALETTVHPEYDPQTYRNDVGIIRVSPLNFTAQNTVRSVAISMDAVNQGESYRAYGWGRTSPGAQNPSPYLIVTTLKAASDKTCANGYKYFDSDTTVCMQVSQTPGNDTCSGDSGGPLVDTSGYLVGITSYGTNSPSQSVDNCGSGDGLGYYVHLQKYLSYLSDKTGLPLMPANNTAFDAIQTTGGAWSARADLAWPLSVVFLATTLLFSRPLRPTGSIIHH